MIGAAAGMTAAAMHKMMPPMKVIAVTPTISRLLTSESMETEPNEVSRIGVVKIVALTVQEIALDTVFASFLAGFGRLENGRIIRCCIRVDNRIKPSVAAKDSCKLRLAMEYGLMKSSNASAASSELTLLVSRRTMNAPAAIRYMTAARMTDGVAPAIGTKNKISGMDAQVPMRRPNSK